MDARIGVLNSGKFYAFVNGYDQPEFIGSLAEVEEKLGLRKSTPAPKKLNSYVVTLRFEFPAWDEVEGIEYETVAESKSDAIKRVTRKAQNDGHAVSGHGRYWFKAVEVN